ncbi:MAG: fibronectin type III domain-containing protein [Candidatus Woesearchaeota archaeon]|nr:fibronectin type III domain-containing protein [Candidatus Woesearchaeota archaeon]
MKANKKEITALFLIALMLLLPVYSANALTISNIRVKNLTSSSADILWDTDAAADSKAIYGNYSYRDFSVSDAALLTEHALTLPDLLPDSKYYYSITSASGSDSAAIGGDTYYFYTNVGDIIAPVISTILVSTTETTATISWTTNEASTSKIYYGGTTDLGSEVSVGGMLTQHNVQLTDLTNNTQYFYIANSCDAYNNCANSSLLSFVAQYADTTPPFINATIPTLYGSSQLDISGRTKQYTTVQLYQNDVLKRALTTDYNGTFLFPAVVLDPAVVPNKIRLHAKDASGNENDANYNITVDLTYPYLDIAPIPQISPVQTLKVNGTVDKNSTIKFYVSLESFDTTPPPAVENVSQSIVTASSIKIIWNPVNVTDLSKYAVYRTDVGRIATRLANDFTDVMVSTNKTYAYQASAVDASGNEGQKSAMLYATTLAGGSVITQLPPVVDFDIITPRTILNNVHGNFSTGLSLQNGYNKIKIEATDNIGHVTIQENTTLFDPNPPVIVENNLGALSPSYIPDVTVKGKVSKNATVYVYVNYDDESTPSYEKVTEPDGTFSVDISLTKEGTLEEYETTGIAGTPSTGLSGEYSPAYVNKIKLIAKDSVERESTPVMGDIKYTQCGFGAWWQVNISEATPDMLTPKLMLIGMSQIGITSQIGWQSGYLDGNIIANPTVEIMPLSAEQKEKYDEDWLQSSQAIWSGDKKTGYVILKIKRLDSIIKGNTSLEKENNLSDHRSDECPVPGMGCIKIPLLLTIRFHDPNLPGYSISPGVGGTQGTLTQTQTLTQKQCWDVIVNIDRRAPSDKIPKAFLTSSVELLNVTIELIDMILKPLNQVKTWVFYGCMGSWAYSFFNWFNEKWNCEYSGGLGEILKNLVGGSGTMKKVAEQGLCDQAFSPTASDDNGKNQACKSCSDSIQRRISWDQTMHWVCDRIFCPAAPTLQNYVEEKKKESIDLFGQTDLGKKTTIVSAKDLVVNANSDCGLVDIDTATGGVGAKKVEDIYKWYKGETSSSTVPLSAEECKKLHPYDKTCCGFEYMREWDSACGAYPKFGFNELEESYCLVNPDDKNVCTTPRKIFNSVAGFCDPQGKATPQLVSGLGNYKEGHKIESKDVHGEAIFYSITTDDTTKPPTNTVKRGYTFQGKQITAAAIPTAVGHIPLTEVSEFIPDEDLTSIFKDLQVLDKEQPAYKTALDAFRTDYKNVANPSVTNAGYSTPSTTTNADKVFNDILSALGTTDKKYIVDPTSGLLRSIQCVCLPGITSYLSLYRSMMDAIRTCFNTILLTGDGNPGICQAVLTQYVCDLVYDLIKCFTKKYSSGFGGRSAGGIGGFLGALTSAGTGVQKSISGRYGGSTIWRTMFAERKLVHAICLFAFTGDWNLDVNTLLNENISVSIQSQPILYPCTRRFIAYNPVSNPSGLTTWSYHLGIGLVAGSPLSYRIYLKCSSGYTCDTTNFAGGKCDCTGAEQTMGVAAEGGTGTLTSGQILDSDTYVPLTESKVRYDTAVLEWTWTDNTGATRTDKQECSITQEGGNPPAFCSFDIGTASYLCRLNIGQNIGEAYFDGDPYVKAEPFKKDEKLQVSARIAQQLPTDAKERQYEYCAGGAGEFCSYTKQLRWTVTNQNGVVIPEMSSGNNAPNQPVKLLSENKQHQFTLPDVIITEDMFRRKASTPTSTTGCVQITNVAYDANKITSGGKISASSISINPNLMQCNDAFELVYNKASDKFGYRTGAYSDGPPPTFTSSVAADKITDCTYDFLNKKVTCSANIQVYINDKPSTDASTIFNYNPQAAQTTTIDSSFNCDNKEQPWNAVFALYDYKKDTATEQYVPSEQKTTYNGAIQEKSVNFKVICDPAAQGTGQTVSATVSSFTVDGKSTSPILLKKPGSYEIKLTTSSDMNSAYVIINNLQPPTPTVISTTDKKTSTYSWTPTLNDKHTFQGKALVAPANAEAFSQIITAYVWEKECSDKSNPAKKGVCLPPENSGACPTSFTQLTDLADTGKCDSGQICCQSP